MRPKHPKLRCPSLCVLTFGHWLSGSAPISGGPPSWWMSPCRGGLVSLRRITSCGPRGAEIFQQMMAKPCQTKVLSGKHVHNYGESPFLLGKLAINKWPDTSLVIQHSYWKWPKNSGLPHWTWWFSMSCTRWQGWVHDAGHGLRRRIHKEEINARSRPSGGFSVRAAVSAARLSQNRLERLTSNVGKSMP